MSSFEHHLEKEPSKSNPEEVLLETHFNLLRDVVLTDAEFIKVQGSKNRKVVIEAGDKSTKALRKLGRFELVNKQFLTYIAEGQTPEEALFLTETDIQQFTEDNDTGFEDVQPELAALKDKALQALAELCS